MLKIYFVLYQRSSKTNRERVKNCEIHTCISWLLHIIPQESASIFNQGRSRTSNGRELISAGVDLFSFYIHHDTKFCWRQHMIRYSDTMVPVFLHRVMGASYVCVLLCMGIVAVKCSYLLTATCTLWVPFYPLANSLPTTNFELSPET